MKSVSLVLLTFNRKDITEKSVRRTIECADYPIDEIIWVDNGSTDGVREYMSSISPDVAVLHKINRGVSRGYWVGYQLATCDLIARPGTDMLMPDGWLKLMVECHEEVEGTGVCSIFGQNGHDFSERRIGKSFISPSGRSLTPAMALGSMVFDRSILWKVGYPPNIETLYGWDDSVWMTQIMNSDFLTYYIDGVRTVHLGQIDEDVEYRKFKCEQIELGRERATKLLNQMTSTKKDI